jgi:hypothetical protein
MPLDGFNRALAITIAGCAAVGGLLAALSTADVADPAKLAPSGWPRDALTYLADLSGIDAYVITFLAGLVTAGGALLLAAELAPVVRQPYVRAGTGTNREFAVRESAVERMVVYAGEQVEGVAAVEEAHVTRDDVGLRVSCKVILEPFAAAGTLAPYLEARICNGVYTMTGLPVSRVRLRISHAEGETLLAR